MINSTQLKQKMDAKPFKPFRIHMSDGKAYDVPNHDAAWVIAGAMVVGKEFNAKGFAELVARCAIIHITRIEDLPARKPARRKP
jgi:hypothetical protein